eukprot:767630-Hanusia_phi.AAC.2
MLVTSLLSTLRRSMCDSMLSSSSSLDRTSETTSASDLPPPSSFVSHCMGSEEAVRDKHPTENISSSLLPVAGQLCGVVVKDEMSGRRRDEERATRMRMRRKRVGGGGRGGTRIIAECVDNRTYHRAIISFASEK